MVPSVTQIKRRLAAMNPVLLVVTHEEQRVLGEIVDLAKASTQNFDSIYVWTFGVGTETYWKRGAVETKKPTINAEHKDNPVAPLTFATTKAERGDKYTMHNSLLVLKDFMYFLNAGGGGGLQVGRALKEVAKNLANSRPDGDYSAILIMDSESDIPDRLSKVIHTVDFDLPSQEEIVAEFRPQLEGWLPSKTPEELSEAVSLLAKTTAGLTMQEVSSALSMSLAVYRDVNPTMLLAEKKSIIRKSGVLEYYDSTSDLSDVGGLGNLKKWLKVRSRAFGEDAKKFGLPPPRAALLLGVPGCGKSLVAKSIGKEWGMPVVRMDIGSLFGSLVGESESRMRKALKTAEAIAPCVLFVDELEKALGHGGQDGGTSQRVFGNFLSWLSDKTAPVFVVATANDASNLPPELLRAGRWDALVFVDLPTEEERVEIARVVARRNGRSGLPLDLKAIAAATHGFSGAEIESTFISAMYTAFSESAEVTTTSWVSAIGASIPLSTTMSEQITELRAWAMGRTMNASAPDAPPVPVKGVGRPQKLTSLHKKSKEVEEEAN
jgi:AAA+ superfamily predicted ATPase